MDDASRHRSTIIKRQKYIRALNHNSSSSKKKNNYCSSSSFSSSSSSNSSDSDDNHNEQHGPISFSPPLPPLPPSAGVLTSSYLSHLSLKTGWSCNTIQVLSLTNLSLNSLGFTTTFTPPSFISAFISPILPNLQTLNLSRNNLTTLTGLSKAYLPNLKTLLVSHNNITDISSLLKTLSDFVGSMNEVDVRFNPVCCEGDDRRWKGYRSRVVGLFEGGDGDDDGKGLSLLDGLVVKRRERRREGGGNGHVEAEREDDDEEDENEEGEEEEELTSSNSQILQTLQSISQKLATTQTSTFLQTDITNSVIKGLTKSSYINEHEKDGDSFIDVVCQRISEQNNKPTELPINPLLTQVNIEQHRAQLALISTLQASQKTLDKNNSTLLLSNRMLLDRVDELNELLVSEREGRAVEMEVWRGNFFRVLELAGLEGKKGEERG